MSGPGDNDDRRRGGRAGYQQASHCSRGCGRQLDADDENVCAPCRVIDRRQPAPGHALGLTTQSTMLPSSPPPLPSQLRQQQVPVSPYGTSLGAPLTATAGLPAMNPQGSDYPWYNPYAAGVPAPPPQPTWQELELKKLEVRKLELEVQKAQLEKRRSVSPVNRQQGHRFRSPVGIVNPRAHLVAPRGRVVADPCRRCEREGRPGFRNHPQSECKFVLSQNRRNARRRERRANPPGEEEDNEPGGVPL